MPTNKVLAEDKFGHGGIKTNPIRRSLRKLRQRPLGRAAIPFDWSKGFDVENQFQVRRKNQGTSSSCGGQAGSYFLEIQRILNGINEDLSAKSVYAPIAYRGGGTTVRALQTQVAIHGANLESAIPSMKGDIPPDESFMADKSWQTSATATDALQRAGFTPINVPITIDSIAEAIRDYNGVIWEIQGQNNGTWLTQYPKPPSLDNPNEIWNHFMFGKGAKMVNGIKQLDFLQSWGSDVGINGVQSFKEDYINSGAILECFAFIPDSHLQPLPENHSIWAELVRWFNSIFPKKVVIQE